MAGQDFVNPQQQHYEAVHEAYRAHYFDASAMAYRRRFIFAPLLKGLDLNGCCVADLACGSGFNSTLLREFFPSVQTEGFDITEKACADYRQEVSAPAYQCDLTRPFTPPRQYDAALVVGGLHHCVLDLRQTLENVAALVRPGGWFLLVEPNARYLLQAVRDLWYRKDGYFDAASERALTHDELTALAPQFQPDLVQYYGGPAYFLILNSLIMRLPLAAKSWLQTPLFAAESLYNCLPGQRPFPVFAARWQRR